MTQPESTTLTFRWRRDEVDAMRFIPGFTGATWTHERIARGALFVFEAGASAIVSAFCTGATAALRA